MVRMLGRLLRLEVSAEWVIVRRGGETTQPYLLEENARRDYAGWMGAALYRRWTVKPASFRMVESKEWDEA